MSENKLVVILLIVFVVLFGLMIMAAVLERGRLDKYADTIAEYAMCIKYNTDGDCSDIILSEYGEEVE